MGQASGIILRVGVMYSFYDSIELVLCIAFMTAGRTRVFSAHLPLIFFCGLLLLFGYWSINSNTNTNINTFTVSRTCWMMSKISTMWWSSLPLFQSLTQTICIYHYH